MKKLRYSINISIAIMLLTIGCKKNILDVAPQDAYSDKTFWTTKKDVIAAINGCYANWESANNLLRNDCFTDNEYYNGYSGLYELFASGRVTAAISFSPVFYEYGTIYTCNWFLENVDKVNSSIVDGSLRERVKAEARFIRAYRYFILTQYYRDVPLITATQTVAEARVNKQTSKVAITDFMLNELAAIAPNLPVEYTDLTDVGRITRGAALALKARIELFNKKYTDCIATCTQLMTAPFNYSIYTSSNPNANAYEELFRPANVNAMLNKEDILDIQYKINQNEKTVLAEIGIFPVGTSALGITQSLVDEYETINGLTIANDISYDPSQPYKNRDKRLDASIIRPGLWYNGIYFDPITPSDPSAMPVPNSYLFLSNDKAGFSNSPTGYNLKKYLSIIKDYYGTAYGTAGLSNTGGNVMVIRYAEVLLTYAEAKIEAGQIDASVYDAINQLRSRAGLPNVAQSNQTAMRDLVRRERRVELAGEGLRWFDIVRWNIGSTVIAPVMACPEGTVDRTNGDLTLQVGSNAVVAPRSYTPKYNIFPIPAMELQQNSNILQNLEYR
ncbi:RagB/SusD family nutrient uptake outer membrane protein [Pedobacter borealis]|uniref:RagB/SusD family nutrient uptake outer membrane protein n=1 Tax=Pedobacter borealis TaxID=475254 RepID=UPI000690142A|nr:RagB/SusD family nutrient uptake outer membrane protein [Pedobacter borealis]